ncbi:MAG TPA: wax ester/triacylglycerol synthase family O-acyltransferase [Solirubrobacteraceae bacterium]|jgi:WS/DGAT/MGAT family acyltransferase
MSSTRLSALDASFLAVETPTAHMHVGWVASFSADADGALPHFSELRDHIARRLGRAPRYRQKLARVPLGLHSPEWIDDPAFSVERHVYWAPGPLSELVDEVMSTPLRRDRPLWEMWICEDTEHERLALVGKAHHCMVDGIAAVELGSLLLDATIETEHCEPDGWSARSQPGAERLLLRGARDLIGFQLGLFTRPLRAVVSSPISAARTSVSGSLRVTRALSNSLRAAPASVLNVPLSPLRRMAWTERSLDDLRTVKQAHGTTVNDVMLAAVAGGIRSYLMRRGERPVALKAMVPVSVRSEKDILGNHISFVFAQLPCDEPDALGRLRQVHATMNARKRGGEPEGADLALKAAEYTPGVVQNAISRMMASPRTFNLVVSNIPGPPGQLYMLGCPLEATYPVVPLADSHAVSVGMTTVRNRACFGVYTDRKRMPDAGRLAMDIDHAIAELLEGSRPSVAGATKRRPRRSNGKRAALGA